MKYFLSQVMAVAVLMTSCAQYQTNSVPISQAVDRGRVKVVTQKGYTEYFNNLFLKSDGNLQGVYKDSLMVDIDTGSIAKIYPLRQKAKKSIKQVWIWPMDKKNKKIRGFLVDVGDSTVSYQFGYQGGDVDLWIYQIDARDIRQVAFRSSNGPLLGFAIGALLPFAILAPLLDGDWSYYGIALVVFHLPGAIIGALAGSAKKKITINGSQEQFMLKKHLLQEQISIK